MLAEAIWSTMLAYQRGSFCAAADRGMMSDAREELHALPKVATQIEAAEGLKNAAGSYLQDHKELATLLEEWVAHPALNSDSDDIPAPAIKRPWFSSLFAKRHADAGLASYTAGLVAAAAFMALSLGPGWVGFLVGFLPASLLTSRAIASHA